MEFTILQTNDVHSNMVGFSPSNDYSSFSIGHDKTRGGYARIASLISARRKIREPFGPVLFLDGGDIHIGSALGAVARETGGDLQLFSMMGCDATTIGNHDLDFGPDGLSKIIFKALDEGQIPPFICSNIDLKANSPRLEGLQKLEKSSMIKQYQVIERGNLKFGVLGVIGKEASMYVLDKDQIKFSDPIKAASSVTNHLIEAENVDIVIALSHGGLMKDAKGKFTIGPDVDLAKAVPDIAVVVSAHSHTTTDMPLLVNGTPVQQTGLYGQFVGELVMEYKEGKSTFKSWTLYPVDASTIGNRAVQEKIESFKKIADEAVFSPRGFSVDMPLAIVEEDWTNDMTDHVASTPIANLVADSYRKASGADIGFAVSGIIRLGLIKGNSGMQTVTDVFGIDPLGNGVLDQTAGAGLVVGYLNGRELKNLLEYFLIDNPAHPGEYWGRPSGLRFYYNSTRPKFDQVIKVELGNLENGYNEIDISGKDERLYSVATNRLLGLFATTVPEFRQGSLRIVFKNKSGIPISTRGEAIAVPRSTSPYMTHLSGTTDPQSLVPDIQEHGFKEIKVWQAVMDNIRSIPLKNQNKITILRKDTESREIRAIDMSKK
jgi:5'-nucleotidase / UDP-sugar diphosphatase